MWELPAILFMLTHDVIAKILLKQITGKTSRIRRFNTQFFFCFILATGILLAADTTFAVDQATLLIVGIGMINSFAAYCLWRAIDISVSKTALFTQADDLIAMGLAYLFLGEAKFLNAGLVAGVALCVLTAVSVSLLGKSKKDSPVVSKDWKRLMLWVAGYSVIWGIVLFATRGVASEGLPLPSFLVAWYLGAFVGSCIIRVLSGKKELGEPLRPRDLTELVTLAIIIVGSNIFYYWSVQLAPLTVVQPIYQVSEMVLPTLVGLFIFHERKKLSNFEMSLFALGIGGCSIVIALF